MAVAHGCEPERPASLPRPTIDAEPSGLCLATQALRAAAVAVLQQAAVKPAGRSLIAVAHELIAIIDAGPLSIATIGR